VGGLGALGADGRTRALLAECLLAAGEPRPRLAALAAGKVRWDRLLALARAVMAEETVAHALVASGLEAHADAGTREALRDAYENGAAKNALLLRDAAELQRALLCAGVCSVVLKGAALVVAHYPALGARHVGDLDLLVRAADVDRARDALRARGLAEEPPPRPMPDPPMPVERHHLAPFLTPGGISCELHFRLPPGTRGDPGGVLERSREVAWQGRTLRVAAPADLAGIAAGHALGTHRDDPRFRARLLADLAVLDAAGADFGEASRLHGPAMVEAVRLLAAARRGLGGGAVPRLVGSSLGAAVDRGAGLARDVARAARDGRLLRLFFPARAFMMARYGVPERRAALLPLAYALRPLRAALRALTGR
jgi:hypothetical protein